MDDDDLSCIYCGRPAKYRVEGWVEQGEDEGYAYTLLCEECGAPFKEWHEEEDPDNDDPRIGGYSYLTDFIIL